jgi:hypothetical protein
MAKKKQAFGVLQFLMLVYNGDSGPTVTTYDNEQEMLEDATEYITSGTRVVVYEAKRIELKLVAQRAEKP